MVEPHPMFAVREMPANCKTRVGTGVIVLDSAGRLLLERRRDCGLWGFLGGKLEVGESLTQCAEREVCEESGLTVRVTELLGIYSRPDERTVQYQDNGDVVQLVDVIVLATIVSGNLQVSEESLELAFFAADQLPPDLVPPAIRPLNDYFTGHRGVLC